MGFVLAGAGLLCLAVFIVKAHEKSNVRPSFGSYLVVILTGFYGVVGFANFFIPMLGTSVIGAVISGALYITGVKVMFWGLSSFKKLQMEA